MQGLLGELSRRNVFRVGAAYGVVAWVLIQVTDSAVPALALPEWVNSLVFYLLLIGLPVVLLFAWAFELTPDGVKRTAEVEAEQSVTSDTGQKINRLLVAALAVAVAFLLYERFLPSDGIGGGSDARAPIEASADIKTLAVLPFVNMSSDPEQEYFSDGITEEILNVLAGIQGLRVTSRTSAFAFKGKNLEIPVIAERLGVDHVLEGSVRKSGTRLRITAQLIDVRTDTHLWSQTYDREIEDIFAIQDEISKAIGEAMQVRLLGGGNADVDADAASPVKHAAVDPEAYDYYLKARQGMNLANFKSIVTAERYALRAVAQAPDFAEAQALLAQISLQMARDGSRPLSEVLGPAKAAVQRALALDPDLPSAHLSMAWVAHAEGRHADERPHFERVLELEPGNVMALSVLAGKIAREDEGGEALAERMMARAMALDPYNPSLLYLNGIGLRLEGKYAEALEIFARIKGIAPDSPYGWLESGDVYVDQGNFVAAIAEDIVATEKDPLDPEIRVYLAAFHLAVGDMDGARIWLDKANVLDATSSFVRAGELLYADQAGDDAQALELAKGILAPGSEERHWSHAMALLYLASQAESAADLSAAIEQYYDYLPGLRELTAGRIAAADTRIDFNNINPFDALVTTNLLQAAGRAGEAAAIIESVEIFIDKINYQPWIYTTRAGLAALAGDADAAFGFLNQWADHGVDELWRVVFSRDPVFASLRPDPRFQALVSRIEQNMARQKAEIVARRAAAAE